MDQDAVLDLFRQSGALLEGHFKLSSGLHSERYLQSALVLQYPEFADALGRALAERTRHLQPTVVLSPALGGIVIGQEVGRALGVREEELLQPQGMYKPLAAALKATRAATVSSVGTGTPFCRASASGAMNCASISIGRPRS